MGHRVRHLRCGVIPTNFVQLMRAAQEARHALAVHSTNAAQSPSALVQLIPSHIDQGAGCAGGRSRLFSEVRLSRVQEAYAMGAGKLSR